MSLGKYYKTNLKRVEHLTDDDWRVAIERCKKHIKWKLKQKTLFGAHTSSNLGEEPIDYYLNLGYEKLLSGDWEWKEKYTLSEQLIRIIDSCISKEVEKTKTQKSENFKVVFKDIDEELNFYGLEPSLEAEDSEEIQEYEQHINIIESAIQGEKDLMEFWDAVCAGYKREDVAAYIGVTPKQLDKVREKFFRRVRTHHSSVN